MPSYDPAVIVKFAEKLYDDAQWITFVHAFIGFFIGAAIGITISLSLPPGPSITLPFSLVLGLLGCAIGAIHGYRKGFDLRLKAQTALCQLQIESHLKDMLQQITRTDSSVC